MNFSSFENKGLTGLSNIGNTCFINATMQVLSHTYELNLLLNKKQFLKQKLNPKVVDSTLLTEWDELRQLMYSENCTIRPSKFVHSVQTVAKAKKNELFSEFGQNDVPEFFLFMIDTFHTALSRSVRISSRIKVDKNDIVSVKCFELISSECAKAYSEMIDLFYGIHLSIIKSIDGERVLSIKAEHFNIINLAITNSDGCKFETLEECFDHYMTGEILDGDNQWFHEESNQKLDVQKTIGYWSLPQILVIDLKRYNSHIQKSRSLITFPIDKWDLSKYIQGTDAESYVYDLYAICNHSGIVFGGHYTAIVKNANGKWYEFDDTNIIPIENEDDIITHKAYCLFYRKAKR
jgi:ubiquitin carboxyl-terminal hydrolase 8